MEQLQNKFGKTDYLPFLWLLMGMILVFLGTGFHIIPVAVWIFPIFIIKFFHSQKILRGSLMVLFVLIITKTIAYWGTYPIPDRKIYILISIIMGISLGILTSLSFIVDRIMHGRLNGILSTLIYPITTAIVFHFCSYRLDPGHVGSLPYTHYGNLLAYSQYGNLAMQQIVSIIGIHGLIFLISWFSTLINWCWEHEFQWVKTRKIAGIYFGIMVLFLIYGGARISFGYPEQDTVRMAGITIPFESTAFREGMVNKACPPIEKNIEMLNRLTRQAAGAGSKIVIWQEYSMFLQKKDEKRLMDECRELAKNENIYLVVAYGLFHVDDLGENKALFVNPSGIVETEYLKHHPVPEESPYMKKGLGELPIMKTPYGNIALTICADIDFSSYIRQAGRKGADIMLIPSLDWKKVARTHTYGITFSAIENGFSLVRCTGSGLSIAVDYHGCVLSSMDYFTSKNRIMYADVPIKGVKTIYTYGGYLFGWLCVIGLCVLILFSIAQNKSQKINQR